MRDIAHWWDNEASELVDILYAGTVDVGVNRNRIVKDFLNTSATWLLWIDGDNAFHAGSVARLFGVASPGEDDRKLVGGLYYAKYNKPWPIAYHRMQDGRYEAIKDWNYGEIIPADAMGMHLLLSHRQVYEDIRAAYVPLMRRDGGIIAVHKDDIQGEIPENRMAATDGKVVDGVWHQRVIKPPIPAATPIFSLAHQRTEDFPFFEMAKRMGHQLWIDTGVESAHQIVSSVGGKDYREAKKKGELTHGGPKIVGE